MRKHWIINAKNQTYVETEHEDFDGNWKRRYPHTRLVDQLEVYAVTLHDCYRTSNGIHYDLAVSQQGAHFILYTDRTKHSKEDIKQAKAELRQTNDALSIHVERLTPVERRTNDG